MSAADAPRLAPRSFAAAERPFSAAEWSSHLSGELGRSVRVTFGRARRSVLVAREQGRVLAVRMNACFAEAPPEVREATAAWLRSGKRARRACLLLDEWIAALSERLAAEPRPPLATRPRGAAHDLVELAAEVLASDLQGAPFPLGAPPALTWGRRGRAGRQLQLGSFDPEANLVRMHPVLDQAAVPRHFVRYVLFHELLHATMPTRRGAGRAIHHPPAFRRRERAYPGYDEALRWQAANLRALLRSSRTGQPMRERRRAERDARRQPDAAASAPRAKRPGGWLFPELGEGRL